MQRVLRFSRAGDGPVRSDGRQLRFPVNVCRSAFLTASTIQRSRPTSTKSAGVPAGQPDGWEEIFVSGTYRGSSHPA